MKTRTLKFIPNICGAAILAASVFLTGANAATLTFQPSVTENFETLGIGNPVSDIGWTGSTNYFLGAVPRSGNPSNIALEVAADNTRRVVWSPGQSPTFTGDTLYFSAQFNIINNGESGARVQIASTNTGGSTAAGKLGGFGITDTVSHTFSFYDAGIGGWVYSDVSAAANTWYELALVIELNPTTLSNSLGYLYYRTVGQEEFTIVPEFNGYQMSWYTADLNASDFAYWRIENARVSAQLDNFAAGMVVPEPTTALLISLSLFAFLSRRRRS